MAPCMLILEDIDTIVTPYSRSYFFNEVDGLENNDGIFMVASTNHLDQLDPGLSSRPSRFDRKYLFPIPSVEERVLYCDYWRKKLASKPSIKFPEKLCPAIAGITQEFSFAYLKEAFVATLLAIAGHRSEESAPAPNVGGGDDDDNDKPDDLDSYELWREMKKQVVALRKDMDNTNVASTNGNSNTSFAVDQGLSGPAPKPTTKEEMIKQARTDRNGGLDITPRSGRKSNVNLPLIVDNGGILECGSTGWIGSGII